MRYKTGECLVTQNNGSKYDFANINCVTALEIWTMSSMETPWHINLQTTVSVWVRSQYCSYWRTDGGKAPGYQYRYRWLKIDCIGSIVCKHVTFTANSIKKKLNFEKSSCLRDNQCIAWFQSTPVVNVLLFVTGLFYPHPSKLLQLGCQCSDFPASVTRKYTNPFKSADDISMH